MTTMDTLVQHDDIITSILGGYLSLSYLYVICSSVCKKWLMVVRKIACSMPHKLHLNESLRKTIISTKLLYIALHNRHNIESPYSLLYNFLPPFIPRFSCCFGKFRTIYEFTDERKILTTPEAFLHHLWPFGNISYDMMTDPYRKQVKFLIAQNRVRDEDDDDDDDYYEMEEPFDDELVLTKIASIHYKLTCITSEYLSNIAVLKDNLTMSNRNKAVEMLKTKDKYEFHLKALDFLNKEGFKGITYEAIPTGNGKSFVIHYYEYLKENESHDDFGDYDAEPETIHDYLSYNDYCDGKGTKRKQAHISIV
jgi:hypothetical protein